MTKPSYDPEVTEGPDRTDPDGIITPGSSGFITLKIKPSISDGKQGE